METVSDLLKYDSEKYNNFSYVEHTLCESNPTFGERMNILLLWADKLKNPDDSNKFVCKVRQVMEFSPTEISDTNLVILFRFFTSLGGEV